MAGMPELSRRAILRLGVGAAAGAAGAYALGSALHTQGASVTGPPVSMTSAGAPLAPPATRARSCGSATDVRRRLVRLGGARRRGDELGDRPSARTDRAAASGDRAARQGSGRRGSDGRRSGAGPRAGGRGGHSAVRGRRGRRRRKLLAQAGVRRGLRRDGAQRTDPDARPRRDWTPRGSAFSAGRWAATARCCSARGSARHAPPRSVRSARRCGRRPARPRPARSTAPTTTPPTACGVCRSWARFRSGSIAATAIRSIRRRSSSSPSCRARRRAASRRADTTVGSGVRSCPRRSRGWLRC